MLRGNYLSLGATSTRLYSEKDHVSWYLKLAITISTWLVLAGYTLFALIFTSPSDNIKVSRGILTALASAFLVTGYAGAGAGMVFSKSLLFRLDSVYLPFFLTSIAGLIEVVANHSIHKKFPVSHTYIIAPLVTASTTTIIFGGLSIITWRRVNNVKEVGERTGAPMAKWETARSGQYGDPAASTELLAMEIPEDEAQRRQLLRLLIAREQERAPSPETSSRHSTYHIDLPSDYNRLAVPTAGRPRGGSDPSITDKWSVKNLLGQRKRQVSETDDVPDGREQRRRQIERESITSLSQPQLAEALSNYEREAATWSGRDNVSYA